MRRSATAVPSSAVPLWMRPASVATKGRARRSARGVAAGRVGRREGVQHGGGGSGPACPAGRQRPEREPDDERERREHRGRAPADPQRGRHGLRGETRSERDQHGPDACGREREHPRRLGIGAGADPVDQRDRPARVGQPVQTSPCAVAEAPADEARDRKRDQEIGRDGAESEPERAIVRLERDDRVDDGDGRERIEQGRADVDAEQRDRQQRHGPVHRRDREAGRAARSPGSDLPDPQHDARRQQDQRHRTGAARRVPERRGAVRGHAAASSRGQPATVCVRPS